MIFLSLVLVIVAAVSLVLGVFQDGLQLVYVSIATCVAAMAVLGVGVLLRRREDAGTAPAGYGATPRPAGAAAGDAATTVTMERPPASVRTDRPGDDAGPGAAAGPDAERPPTPVKKAVVRKATGPRPAPLRVTSGPDVPRMATAAPATGRTAEDLARVKGLGPSKQQALLERFGSVDAIAAASIEELTTVRGIGEALARAVKTELH